MGTSLKITLLVFLCGMVGFSFGQIRQGNTADTLQEFEILQAKSLRAINIDSVTTLQAAAGNVIIQQEGNKFYADSTVLNPVTHVLEAFGNIHINQGDTIHTYGQYLKYLGAEKIAYIEKNVRLTDGKGTLVTQQMDYNMDLGIGNFYKGGRVTEGKNVINSENGTYYADTKDVYFKKKVVVTGEKNLIKADSLLYNMETKMSSFISPTYIKNNEVELTTTQGTYDLKTGNALFTERTNVTESSGRKYSANHIGLEGTSGNVQLEGNAVVIDTANSFMLLANQIFMNRKNNSFLATRKPLLIVKHKNDSTYIAADTIFSGLKINMQEENPAAILQGKQQQDDKVLEIIESDSTGAEGIRDAIRQAESDTLRRVVNDSAGVVDEILLKGSEDSIIVIDDASRKTQGDSLRRSQADTLLQVQQDSTRPADSSVLQQKQTDIRQKVQVDSTRPALRDTVRVAGEPLRKEEVVTAQKQKVEEKNKKTKSRIKRKNAINKNAADTLPVSQKDTIHPNSNITQNLNDTLPANPNDSNIVLQRPADTILKAEPLRGDSISLKEKDSLAGEINIQKAQNTTGDSLLLPTLDTAVTDSTIRYFMAFHHVRIFNDSLQGASDSLYFSTEDSVFRMYKDPVLWSGQSQITGDTMYLFTRNKEPQRLYVFEKGMMVNRTREGFFNQMAGKTINAYFLNGKIDYLRVKGSQSQSIYYMQDEDSLYIGMNKAVSDVIDMFFANDNLQKVAFVNEVKGQMYPMGQIPEEERKLPNFKWLDERRPKTKFELYE